MPFPTQTELEVPLLRTLDGFGGEVVPRQIYDELATQYPQITADDLEQRMDSGAVKWWNHVQWVRQKLVQRGEIDGAVRGVWRITDKGRERLRGASGQADSRPQAVARPQRVQQSGPAQSANAQSPGELIESAHREIRAALSEELLQTIMSSSPAFFERLVIDLLVKMGYGGTRKDAGAAIGRVGDGGIDGIIKEDRLGIKTIFGSIRET